VREKREKKEWKPETTLLHTGDKPDLPVSYPDIIPIYQTAAFVLEDLASIAAAHASPAGGYFYSRAGNPNTDSLAAAIAAAEGGEAGAVCASGMAAILTGALAMVGAGDHIVAADDLYGGTYGLLKNDLAKLGIESSFVDLNDAAAVRAAVRPNTKLFITEVLTNPFVKVFDIGAIAATAHAAGAKLLVDNTFTTPYHIRTLDYGADIVIHSATKYIGGHNDVTAGAVVAAPELVKEVRRLISSFGCTLGPFDAWLVLRGIKTMSLRVLRQAANAQRVAEALAAHPKVGKVYYPGLPDNPQHALAVRLLRNGFGSMLSFTLPDDQAAVNRFMRALRLVKFVTTLGGVKTTLSHPATTSHVGLEDELKQKLGIHAGLIRLSVGIEDADDLIDDLDGALAVV